ncbi:MAG: Ada metal-binding domain-containing protein [Xanthobacteraceae bacterium]|jgi:methylphosphotriester-DNA--protein-cysteine methyltransferase
MGAGSAATSARGFTAGLIAPSALCAIKRGRTYQQHRVFFADEASALAAGFRPCARCMRDAYTKWRRHIARA